MHGIDDQNLDTLIKIFILRAEEIHKQESDDEKNDEYTYETILQRQIDSRQHLNQQANSLIELLDYDQQNQKSVVIKEILCSTIKEHNDFIRYNQKELKKIKKY